MLAAFLVYAQVTHFDFVNFDDPDYVTRNFHVRYGITPEGLAWALTSAYAANWFPVTWISHMLDCQFFGIQAGFHHLTNVVFHALAGVLLFVWLARSTGDRWCAAFVAWVFLLHPLHVESVAWVAERKDVLCALFWFLTLWAYLHYTRRPALRRYLLVLAPFCLGLMSKPMFVTVPLVMLMIDYWPLRRTRPIGQLLYEKVPFFALSAAAAIATYLVQAGAGAVRTFSSIPLGLRIGNAAVSYIVYPAKMLWPSRLAVFYPYPLHLPVWEPVLASLVIAGITAAALRFFRRCPYLAVGWLWYLCTMTPVIGIVQVGGQARADRYMYVPMAGLSLVLAWGAADILHTWPRMKPAIAAIGVVACLACVPLTWAQTGYWKNSETLFQHAIDVTAENYLAQHNLGNHLLDVPGRLPDAIAHLQAALRINPDSAQARTDLAIALSKTTGGSPQAISEYEAAVRMAPDSAIPHNNLGVALSNSPGRLTQAISEFEAALRINPDYPEAHNNLGRALAETPGRLPQAISEYEAALRIKPDYPEAHDNLGKALAEMPGRLPQAIAEFQAALRLNPESAEVHYDLGVALSRIGGRSREAADHLESALRMKPGFAEAHNDLGVVLSDVPGRLPEAFAHFETALRLKPEYAEAHYNLGVALANAGRVPEAITHFEAALRIHPDAQTRELVDRLRAGRPPG